MYIVFFLILLRLLLIWHIYFFYFMHNSLYTNPAISDAVKIVYANLYISCLQLNFFFTNHTSSFYQPFFFSKNWEIFFPPSPKQSKTVYASMVFILQEHLFLKTKKFFFSKL
nr:hypothetical protein Itr_chr15CG12160 [Ipomoea trifida]